MQRPLASFPSCGMIKEKGGDCLENNSHNSILKQYCNEAFLPLGIFQKGSSRIYIDDNGYFFTVIEFQPSGYAKGFYLNIALHFLWNERDYLSFDFPSGTGVRLGNFIEYHDDLQFCRELSQAIKKALEQVMFYRTFRDMQVIKRYAKKWTSSDLDAFRHLDTQDGLEKIRRTRAYWRSKPSMKKLSHHAVYD